MYCNHNTLKLALEKGFTYCTCSNGGYPDCICYNSVYSKVRLDDISNWLRVTHCLNINIVAPFDNMFKWQGFVYKLGLFKAVTYTVCLETYEEAFEKAIEYSLTHIKCI